MHSACFLPADPQPGVPFPPRFPGNRVPVVRVPLLRRYYETLRLPVVLPAVLRFLRLAVPLLAPVFVSPRGPDADPGTRNFRFWQFHDASFSRNGNDGISQVPGESNVLLPCSPTPAGPTHQAIA